MAKNSKAPLEDNNQTIVQTENETIANTNENIENERNDALENPIEQNPIIRFMDNIKMEGSIQSVDKALGFLLPKRENYQYDNEVVESASGPIKFGMWLYIFIFIVIGGWAAFAPLNSAAVAVGQISLTSSSKVIDHLEGGIIKSFSVKEGDFVNQGDELLRFDETSSRANLEIHTSQLNNVLARRARLFAERDNLESITFPEELTKKMNDPKVAEIIKSEINHFTHRRNSLKGQIQILKKRIKQFEEEIEGLTAQKTAGQSQVALIKEEVDVVEQLVNEGKAVKPRLLALKRDAASIGGKIGEYGALIARARQSIAENELSIIKLSDDFQTEISKDLNETQLKIADLRERIIALQDVLNRVVIRAPRSGIVTGIEYHTIGGTVPPGRPIMSLVPQDDEKIVIARVSPRDIDVVTEGLKAKVRLSAYRSRYVPPLEGEVISVSPDSFIDKNTGATYYEARIHLNEEYMKNMAKDIDLIPGMSAEVMIVTGEKTALRYLLDPIIDSTRRAFREE